VSEADREDRKRDAAKPGAVRHDTRGNAVWQWAVQTGRHAIDSTSALLRRLDVSGLSIEGDTTEEQRLSAKGPEPERRPADARLEIDAGDSRDGGYDPYGRGLGKGKPPARPSARPAAAAKPVSRPAPAPAARRSSWWRRLLGGR